MCPTDLAARVRGARSAQDGFAIIEVMAAMVVLMTGVVGLLMGFVDSQKLSLSAERQATMSQVAQRELERIQGLPYATIALTSTPVTSANSTDPNARVAAGPPATYTPVGSSTAEPLVIDATNGALAPAQSWSQGDATGTVDTYVTWVSDPNCGPGCPSSQNYKRITVAVVMAGTASPSPIVSSTVISDPNAAPKQGTVNGTAGNPVASGSTTCQTVSGTTTTQSPCEAPLAQGVPNALFLHDCPASTATCPAPVASHALNATVAPVANPPVGQSCSAVLTLASQITSATTGACPTPDKMDASVPAGTNGALQYSTDVGTTGYTGGRLLQPLCGLTTGCGSGSTTDCTADAPWTSNLVNTQNELWVTPPLAAPATLTGQAALNMFSQTQNGTSAVISLCVEIYSVPPSGGIAGSLADLLAWPPVALGGAGYVAATNPGTNGNWPGSPSSVGYTFGFAPNPVTVPAGNRIGLRIWMKASVNNAIALMYDSSVYPSELQLNSQASITYSGT